MEKKKLKEQAKKLRDKLRGKLPCNDSQGDCGKGKENPGKVNTQENPHVQQDRKEEKKQDETQGSPQDGSISSRTAVPCCCACSIFPCVCQCEKFEDSLLYKVEKALRDAHDANESDVDVKVTPASCEGNDCETEASVKPVTNQPAPMLMCCCHECSSFPCECSCDYFTLSKAPP
jgi:hypothetical protein